MKRSFVKPSFEIIVLAHKNDQASGDLVDRLDIIQLNGNQGDAVEFLAKLQRLYIGKPRFMWENAEFDE